jgi:hypothetical protein
MFQYTVEAISPESDSTLSVQLISKPADVLELFCRDVESPRVQKIEVKNSSGQTVMLFVNEELTWNSHMTPGTRRGDAPRVYGSREFRLAVPC